MSKRTYEMTMLLDFYGELLTEKQRDCAQMYYNEDLSLTEIAEILGITRQGVRDLVVRACAILTETEEKIRLLERFSQERRLFEEMARQLEELAELTSGKSGEIVSALRETLGKISN